MPLMKSVTRKGVRYDPPPRLSGSIETKSHAYSLNVVARLGRDPWLAPAIDFDSATYCFNCRRGGAIKPSPTRGSSGPLPEGDAAPGGDERTEEGAGPRSVGIKQSSSAGFNSRVDQRRVGAGLRWVSQDRALNPRRSRPVGALTFLVVFNSSTQVHLDGSRWHLPMDLAEVVTGMSREVGLVAYFTTTRLRIRRLGPRGPK